MKSILGIVILLAATSAAGSETGRPVSYDELEVLEDAYIEVNTSHKFNNCVFVDLSSSPKVQCPFIRYNWSGTVTFGNIKFDSNQVMIRADFQSLVRD